MNRRGFLAGLLAAPAIIRTPGLLMPVSRKFGATTYLPSRIHGDDDFTTDNLLVRATERWLPIPPLKIEGGRFFFDTSCGLIVMSTGI